MMVGGRRIGAIVAVLACTFLSASAATAAQPLGALNQLAGTTGCFTFNGTSEEGAGTCSTARGLAEGESAIVSPDGANVYAGSYANPGATLKGGFAVFARNKTTSALTQLGGPTGCLTPDGSSTAGPGTCTEARGLISNAGDGHDVAFSSDGRWAYLVAQNDSGQPGAVMIFQRDTATGALAQLGGSAGCITTDGSSQDGAGTCQTDATLSQPMGTVVSADDRFLYVTDYGTTNRIHVFSRNTTTGALSEVQCLSEAPAPTGCSTGRVLGDSQLLALSPDGTHAYSGDYLHGMSVLDRNPSTGLLTQKAGTAGCISDDGKDNTGAITCTVGRQLNGTYPILIAPNGATLYDVAGFDGGFSVFHINADGSLTQLSGADGCVTIDGKDNTGASTCTVARAVDGPYGGVISPDGGSLYISHSTTPAGGVAVFSLNQTTGVATQLPGLQGCITADGSSHGTPGVCTNGRALSEGWGMSISPDGSSVYQATDDSTNAGLAVFARESAPVCQAATVTTASRTPVTVPLHCSDPDGDAVTRSIVSGPAHGTLSAVDNSAGTVTYTPATEFSGKDSFTFAASDGVNQGAPATATITVTPGPLPTCGSASVRTAVGRPVTVPLRCSDADGDTVSRSIVSRPAHGALSPVNNAAGTVTYAPASGFIGSDTFTFSASDGVNRSAPATASLTVIRARLSRLHVSPSSFSLSGRKVKGRCVKPTRKNGHHQRCRRPISLRVSYTLNVADTVTLRIERQVAGRKVKGRCVKPTRGNGKHRKCNRFLRVRGKITLHGVPGANHFTFTGKIGGRRLGLGTYRLIATPAGGNTTKVIFKLVR